LEGSPTAIHILQVAYYPSLLEIRTKLLESSGYQVTSVLGNDNAIALDGAAIATVDLVVVGFSAPHSVRAAMVRWCKAHYPNIPVIALQFHGWEQFPEADVTLSEDPNVWLAAVANTIKS
jgi:DNA-binding NarL/FixJ family response regulator